MWIAVVRADAVDWPTLGFTQVSTNSFAAPTCIAHAGDNSQRLFIVQKAGQIRMVQTNVVTGTFLDISNRVMSSGAEQGLLGLAFSPGFSTNGHFYVDYTRQPDGAVVISRFSLTADPNVANTNSEQIIKVVSKPANNHNGGQIAFGPDGYLYIGIGDGGFEGDPQNYGQNTNSLLGKILRIDVESGVSPYAVPPSNPFVGLPGYQPEIWAYGLRNPWRFSFDRSTGDLYIGDVGQNFFEEIDFQPAGSAGGQNYGWRVVEGPTNFNVPSGFTNFGTFTPPAIWYDHRALPTDLSAAVTGGYVCRSAAASRMNGIYFYGDYVAGWIWGAKQSGTNWLTQLMIQPVFPGAHYSISTFGEDDAGNLYLADIASGKIYAMQDSQQVWAPTFSPTNGFDNLGAVTVNCLTPGAVIHYTTNGIDPTESDPTVASGGSFPVNSGITNKARAFRADLNPSAVTMGIFTNRVGTPTFAPPQGSVTNGTYVTISTVTAGATIYYTTNGTPPTTSSPIYTGPLIIDHSQTLRAFGTAPGYTNGLAASATFYLAQVATPLFNPASGPITNGTKLAISCSTTGSTIFYTVDGTPPTTNSAIYSGPITINGGTTVEAFATAPGYINSSVMNVFYQLVQTATPVFSPSSGPITNGTTITISCATPGSTIYYTLDGSTPTNGSIVYSGPITINGGTTLSAFATTDQHLDSAVQTVFYDLTPAPAPTFSPSQGPLTNKALISIQSALSNAIVRYTMDGSDPDSNSLVYVGPISFTNPVTLKARVYADQLNPSAVSSQFFGLLDFKSTVVTTLAGGITAGFSNGPAALARFFSPAAVAMDSTGNLYVADTGNNAIRKISTNGQVSTIASNGGFNVPSGVCLDSAGNIYVADSGNCNRICRIDSSGNVTVVANVTQCGVGIGNFGPGLGDIKPGPDGNLYVGYWASVRQILPNGTVNGLAGTGCNCPGGWGLEVGPAVDAATNVYSATGGFLWRTTPNGVTDVFSGGIPEFSDGPRQLAGMPTTRDAFIDALTNIYVSDTTRIRKLSADGWVSTLAGTGISGYQNGRGAFAQFNGATGLCMDTNGNIYVADTGNNCIRKISPDTAGIGIADDWQRAHFGMVGIDPNADPDHDGMSNLAEFWAGTDPLNANSMLTINSKTILTNGVVNISWQSVAGKSYVVKYSADLRTWNDLGTPMSGDGSILTVTDSPPQAGQRFYRIFLAGF